ncbi:efflux transporter outer membrane subunit [Comamonas sp. lk]|uniref:efflux transporter outer membrane subunit n=1 Tax=Comamonas sp. lk TaxID=2201272 RepID=UPI000EADB4C1
MVAWGLCIPVPDGRTPLKPAPTHTLSRLSACCLGTLVLLAGCSAPVPVRLNTDMPAHWQQALPVSPKPGADLAHWWKSWNDTELNALVDEALAQNLDVAQAVLRLQQQKRLSEVSGSAFLPNVSAGVRTLQDVAAQDSYFHASVDVSWDLGLFGASEAATRSASADVLDAQAQLHAARVALVAQVVHRYLDIRQAQRQQALLQQRQALDQRQLQLLQIRQTQRLGSMQAVEQQQLQIAAAAGQTAMLTEAQARSAHGLAALLGRSGPDPRWLQAADATTAMPAAPAISGMPLAAIPADLLRTRPDIQSAEAAVEHAAAELGITRAALYPRFTLTGSILYSYNITQNRRNAASDKLPVFGPQIDVPLFDWSRRRAQADARELALQASVKAYRQSVLNGIADVESSLAAIGAQEQRRQSLQATQSILQQRQQAQTVRQNLGLESELSTLETRRSLLQLQSETDTAGFTQALAFVTLYKALGGAPLDTVAQSPAKGLQP